MTDLRMRCAPHDELNMELQYKDDANILWLLSERKENGNLDRHLERFLPLIKEAVDDLQNIIDEEGLNEELAKLANDMEDAIRYFEERRPLWEF